MNRIKETKLYQFIKETKLYQFIGTIRRYYIYELIFSLKRFMRRHTKNNKYIGLKLFKNKYEGKRCFIVATGPSMTMNDLRKLKNEYTFGMNSLCKVFDEVGWETTFFGIQDLRVYKKMYNDLGLVKKSIMFIGDNIKDIKQIKCPHFQFPFNRLNHGTVAKKYLFKFSNDIYEDVYAGFTIAYSLLQISVYMGFKEIYLLGCDCHYPDDKNKRYFVKSGHYDSVYKITGERMILAYKVAKEYADAHGIKIYNATHGGMLEVFQRVDLGEVL